MSAKQRPLLRNAVLTAASVVGVFVLLPLALPFVLAYLISWWVEPAVAALGRRTHLPRWLRSGLCVTGLLLLVGAGLFLFCQVAWTEIVRLARQLPTLLRQLRPGFEALRGALNGLARKAPPEVAAAIESWLDRVFASGGVFLQSLSGFLTGLVSGLVTGLPKLVLTLITTVIASYMTSAALPEVKLWLKRTLPKPWMERLGRLHQRCHQALGGWCKAQLKMMGIVFALLTLGFWILGVEFPILFGGLISVLDALPVLGTGTVLIPWAMTCFLQGASTRGFGLLTLYALTALGRTALEPRLVGRSLGLHPLLTLAAFYIGFRTFGVPGMILLPLLAIVVKQFMQKPAQSESR